MKIRFLLILLNFSVPLLFISEINACTDYLNLSHVGDTIRTNQVLYNGKIWRDLYTSIHEDQFLFSQEFLPGSVTVNGKRYNNLELRYDILNDEIMTITDKGLILQLNKEMIDSFTIVSNSRTYEFFKLPAGNAGNVTGYANIRYHGKTSLFIKQQKEISKMGAGKNYENFVQFDRTYVVIDSIQYRIRSKRDLKILLSDKKEALRNFIRTNRIEVSKKLPDTYIPVLEFYDSLKP